MVAGQTDFIHVNRAPFFWSQMRVLPPWHHCEVISPRQLRRMSSWWSRRLAELMRRTQTGSEGQRNYGTDSVIYSCACWRTECDVVMGRPFQSAGLDLVTKFLGA